MRGMAVAVLVSAAALAGCTGTTAGQPTTARPTGTTSGTETPTTTTESPFVERPRDIPLDDLNPCDVWTPDQLRQLGVSTKPLGDGPSPDALGNMGCSFRGPQEPVEIGYTAVTALDADLEDTLHGQSRTTSTVIEIAGFPAVQAAKPEGSIDPCSAYVGTAQGQHLRILLATLWPNDKSVDETCAMARAAAEMAMETLQSLR